MKFRLKQHPSLIFPAATLAGRLDATPAEALRDTYADLGIDLHMAESYDGESIILTVCVDCQDDGASYQDDDGAPICVCLVPEEEAA